MRGGQGHARVDDPAARLRRGHVLDHLPHLSRRGAVGYLHLNLLGDGGQDIVDDLLILGDPLLVLGVVDQLRRLLSRFGNLLGRRRRFRLDEVL